MNAIDGFQKKNLLMYVIIYNTDIAMTSCCDTHALLVAIFL